MSSLEGPRGMVSVVDFEIVGTNYSTPLHDLERTCYRNQPINAALIVLKTTPLYKAVKDVEIKQVSSTSSEPRSDRYLIEWSEENESGLKRGYETGPAVAARIEKLFADTNQISS